MQIRALFIGFSTSRTRSVVKSIEQVLPLSLEVAGRADCDTAGPDLADRFDCIFVNKDTGTRPLGRVLDRVKSLAPRLPVVLTYGSEPDGKDFHLASKYDCLLFSEIDRLKRGLTPGEIGEALAERLEAGRVKSHLMGISLCSGPCSTGD